MELLTEKLFPGVVFLIAGLTFIVYQEKLVQNVLVSHRKFWNETVKLKGEIGRPGEVFLNILIYFLGVAFLLGGLFLLYGFIKEVA